MSDTTNEEIVSLHLPFDVFTFKVKRVNPEAHLMFLLLNGESRKKTVIARMAYFTTTSVL